MELAEAKVCQVEEVDMGELIERAEIEKSMKKRKLVSARDQTSLTSKVNRKKSKRRINHYLIEMLLVVELVIRLHLTSNIRISSMRNNYSKYMASTNTLIYLKWLLSICLQLIQVCKVLKSY